MERHVGCRIRRRARRPSVRLPDLEGHGCRSASASDRSTTQGMSILEGRLPLSVLVVGRDGGLGLRDKEVVMVDARDTVALAGLGAVTGYGWGLGELWKGLMSGRSAAHRLVYDDFDGLAVTVP